MKIIDTIIQSNPFRKKNYSKGSSDMIKMLEANEARTEESATKNSNWHPGALHRLKKKERLDKLKARWKGWTHRNDMIYQAEQRNKNNQESK
jgi:hypothetical protein